MDQQNENVASRWMYGLLLLGAIVGISGLAILVFEPMQLLITNAIGPG